LTYLFWYNGSILQPEAQPNGLVHSVIPVFNTDFVPEYRPSVPTGKRPGNPPLAPPIGYPETQTRQASQVEPGRETDPGCSDSQAEAGDAPAGERTPNANAYAERWVRTVREECLNHLLILNQSHLRRVLKTYTEYYNETRPHQGMGQRIPVPPEQSPCTGAVEHRKVLGGSINDYRSSGDTAVHLH
jgi:hypothetical protein